MTKLTFVLDTFGGGGKERRCLQLIQGLLKRQEYQIQVVLIDGLIEYEELYQCDISLTVLYREEQHKKPWTVFKEVKQALRSFQPDIVQAWGYMSAFYTLPLSSSMKFGYVASYVADILEPDSLLKKFINYSCIRKCKYIIGNSLKGLSTYHIPGEKAICIYNGFNEDRFQHVIDKETYKQHIGITTPYVVSMMAAFRPDKDWKCFIEAARLLAQKRRDITFLCIGAGPDWDLFNHQIYNNERKYIKFLGRRSDIDELIQITDLSVLCTNPQVKEGLSNTIVESMAWGVPVIATAGGGTPEIIEDNKNGLLIQDQQPTLVAELIESLLDDVQTRKEMSSCCKQVIQDRFLLTKMTQQYEDVYRKCLKY